ncbi:cyclic nucleotide-binding domain-containing protein [Thermodesulfobacteriota bacterium]
METIKSFKMGDTVIEEGAKGTSAFVIMSGTAKVFKGIGTREITMATLREGQVFGEMGLIEDRPRSATIRADSTLKVRVIDREQFNELLKVNPSVLIPIMKSLFERLRQASEMLAEKSVEKYSKAKDEKKFEVLLYGQTVEAKRTLGNKKLHINNFPFLVGRYASESPDSDVFHNNDFTIEEEKPYVISRNHLSINNENGILWVVDRGSAFGVIVNGKDIGGSSGKTRTPLDKEENQVIIGPARSKYIFLLKITAL